MASYPTHVLDTSVCIDLYWGGLVQVFLDLPFDFTIPDFTYIELTEPHDLATVWNKIKVSPLTGDQISRVYVLKQDKRCRRLTINDLAAFVLAKDLHAVLLCNDQDLRRLAEREKVSCHGILWLLDILVNSSRISPGAATHALRAIIAHGSWLPKQECEKRLREWGR